MTLELHLAKRVVIQVPKLLFSTELGHRAIFDVSSQPSVARQRGHVFGWLAAFSPSALTVSLPSPPWPRHSRLQHVGDAYLDQKSAEKLESIAFGGLLDNEEELGG